MTVEALLEDGLDRVILVVVPHADDATIRCGGTLALLAARGWHIILARVTNDALDSVALDRTATIERNARELRQAARLLGIAEIVELGYETDRLADVSEVELRERAIRLYRLYRPYAVFAFDPFPRPGEDNQDHLRVASACDEAFWTAMFDKHHPEHFREGLAPHGVFERWYFARGLREANAFVDISGVIDLKVEALAAHATMVENMIAQVRHQAETGAITLPDIGDGIEAIRSLARRLIVRQAEATGQAHGLRYAEEFRLVRFSGLFEVLSALGA